MQPFAAVDVAAAEPSSAVAVTAAAVGGGGSGVGNVGVGGVGVGGGGGGGVSGGGVTPVAARPTAEAGWAAALATPPAPPQGVSAPPDGAPGPPGSKRRGSPGDDPPKKKGGWLNRVEHTLNTVAQEYLTQWCLDNIGHPYPNEREKHEICAATHLTFTQVNDWCVTCDTLTTSPHAT